jgi:ubiquitin conjugation factor E4 B
VKAEPAVEAASPGPSGASTPPAKAESSEPTKSKITITSSSTPPTQQPANPFTKLGASPSSSIRITPSDGAAKRARVDSGTETPPRKSTTTSKEETLEAFENRILGNVFRVTLDESRQYDPSGHRLIYLPNLRQDLEESGEAVTLTVGTLDSAILEAASKVAHNKPVLGYLLPCWKRTIKALKGLRGAANGRDTVLKEARRLCLSNCIFALTMPELFGSVLFMRGTSDIC